MDTDRPLIYGCIGDGVFCVPKRVQIHRYMDFIFPLPTTEKPNQTKISTHIRYTKTI